MNWSSHEFIWLDWVVLTIGLLGVVAAVWYAIWKDKKAQQGEDSSAYLFGKGEPWYVIGMAIFAANIGSEHLVGLAGTGAKSGVGMAHWEMQGWMILILGWLFVPFYQLMINKMGKIITMPDFLKFRYTQRTGSWLSIITLVAYILTKVSVTALTGGIFFKYLWGLNFWYGAIGLILITAVFTVFGGMKPRSFCSRRWQYCRWMGKHDGLLRTVEQWLWYHSYVPLGRRRLDVSGVSRLCGIHRCIYHRFLVLVYRPAHCSACTWSGTGRG